MFEQLDPLVTPASEIRCAAKETALREITSQKEQFRQFGIMANWDSKEGTYRTFGMYIYYLGCELILLYLLPFNKTATTSFVSYGYSKKWLRKACFLFFYLFTPLMVIIGLIYRQHKPVYYSPSSRSALAEAELEYKQYQSPSAYVLFDIDKNSTIENEFLRNIVSTQDKVQLAVWTTTPWTLSANMVRFSDRLVGSPADVFVSCISKGIAVNDDLIYDLTRCKNDISGEGIVIFANSRLVPISDVLKPVYRFGQVKGMQSNINRRINRRIKIFTLFIRLRPRWSFLQTIIFFSMSCEVDENCSFCACNWSLRHWPSSLCTRSWRRRLCCFSFPRSPLQRYYIMPCRRDRSIFT